MKIIFFNLFLIINLFTSPSDNSIEEEIINSINSDKNLSSQIKKTSLMLNNSKKKANESSLSKLVDNKTKTVLNKYNIAFNSPEGKKINDDIHSWLHSTLYKSGFKEDLKKGEKDTKNIAKSGLKIGAVVGTQHLVTKALFGDEKKEKKIKNKKNNPISADEKAEKNFKEAKDMQKAESTKTSENIEKSSEESSKIDSNNLTNEENLEGKHGKKEEKKANKEEKKDLDASEGIEEKGLGEEFLKIGEEAAEVA